MGILSGAYFRDTSKPMGVSTYKLTTELPEKYREILPSEGRIEEVNVIFRLSVHYLKTQAEYLNLLYISYSYTNE